MDIGSQNRVCGAGAFGPSAVQYRMLLVPFSQRRPVNVEARVGGAGEGGGGGSARVERRLVDKVDRERVRVPLVPVCERLAHRQVCDALDLATCAPKSSIAFVGPFASLRP